MSDPAVNAHLEGIISDFEALKRSFEVEEVDQAPNSTSTPRRTPNPLLRSTVATPKFQDVGVRNSDGRHTDMSGQKSPKTSLRRVELSGAKVPEPVPRRTEISIDISSKQVDHSSSSLSRYGLKRGEAAGHKPPEPVARRTEVAMGKPQEATIRRVDSPPTKIPELPQRRADTSPPIEVLPKRVEIQVAKAYEAPPPPVRQLENSLHFPTNQQPYMDIKQQLVIEEITAVTPDVLFKQLP